MSHEEVVRTPAFEEDLSRMELTYGKGVIGKLKGMSVLIIGLRGLGVETAKNLILAGPRKVTLHDDEKVVIADLGANFYLRPESVGHPRAASCFAELKGANPNVDVNIHSGELDAKFLVEFDVVVSTDDAPLAVQIERNNIVRERNKKFIYGNMNGVFVSIFSDFANHVISDSDGEPVFTVVLEKIISAKGKPTICQIDTEARPRHGFYTGDVVKLEEAKVEGKDQPDSNYEVNVPLNGTSSTFLSNFVVKEHRYEVVDSKTGKKRFITDHTKFEIADCSGAGVWQHGGIVTGVKQPTTTVHRALSEQLVLPEIDGNFNDLANFGVNYKLHIARRALWAYQAKHGCLPALHSAQDAEEVLAEAKSLATEPFTEKEENYIKACSLYARAELTSLAALFGGVVAQEVIKFAGKYTPINQWIHYAAFEVLHSKGVPVDAAPLGCRYDHQISIIGKAAHARVGKSKTFLIGCGALGCEFLKGLAMSGYGCAGGVVNITDMDTIELSNLSRQFLFRRRHVNCLKSESAADVVKEMNPEMKAPLKVYQTKVATETEDLFDAKFWDGLDFVVNALDNVHARAYSDSKCVAHNIPLFESGTLGTKANTAIGLPHVTRAYSEGAVAGEDQGIAQCTLQNFPSLPLHCIEFAREKFDDLFSGGARKLTDFLDNGETFLERVKSEGMAEESSLREVINWLNIVRDVSPSTPEKTLANCVRLAFDSLLQYFTFKIKDLQAQYPEDLRDIDKESGADLGPYWRGHKRFPRALEYSASNESQLNYIYHAVCIYAEMFRLKQPTEAEVAAIAATLTPPAWQRNAVKIEGKDGKEGKAGETDTFDEAMLERLRGQLRGINRDELKGRVIPTNFEKDDDKNHHIDFITAASGFRAWNYQIKEPPKMECRAVAGKIIAAIATTTACITGFIQLEMLKYITGAHHEDFRGVTLNLAVNNFTIEKLPDPNVQKSGTDKDGKAFKCVPENFTVFDHLTIVHPRCTGRQFADLIRSRFGVLVESLIKPGTKNVLATFGANPFTAAAATAREKLAKGVNNPGLRVKFEKSVADFDAHEAKSGSSADLISVYEAKNGPILGGNCAYLTGVFFDATTNDLPVKMPVIKWYYN